MNSEKLKSKLIYFGAILGMCAILVLLTYNYFLRTIRVDVMKDIVFTYTGENGNASVIATNESDDLNKRTQDFLNTVTYEITPNSDLSNGDTIHVVASFNESIASQYHFEAKNVEKDFEVEGLNYRYETLEDIDEEYLDKILQTTDDYIESNKQEIYQINVSKDGEFKDTSVFYKAFLKSKTSEISDRIIVVYKLIYEAEVEIEESEETEIEERAVYYIVTIPDINDGNQVSGDVFGEKAYLTEEERANENIQSYVQRVYGSQYDIEEIIEPEILEEQEQEQEESEDEK